MSTHPKTHGRFEAILNTTDREICNRARMINLLKESPIPDYLLQSNLGLYVNRQTLSRFIFMHDMYLNVLEVPGVVMEFGCRWGQNLALFMALRGMYEPYNHTRKIVGFDTFNGLTGVEEKDGVGPLVQEGALPVSEGYQAYLEELLNYHNEESPLSHLKKHEVIAGDARAKLPEYLDANPQTLISLAYFDMDLYAPTKECLGTVLPRMPKGAVLGFDELNHAQFPGETTALIETLNLPDLKFRRSPNNPYCCYAIL